MRWPTLQSIYRHLSEVRKYIEQVGISDVDVRLQVLPGGAWQMWEGDPSYDTDHRGFWGAGYVSAKDSATTLRALARDLLEGVKDAKAMSE